MSPTPTAYPAVNDLLEHLRAQLHAILNEKFVGLYLYGSLITGDFVGGLSDVDLLAVLNDDLTPADFDALDHMHNTTVQNAPQWQDRLEIAYLSRNALQTFKTQSSKIGIISPGEPFHIIDAGREWLLNWYIVRQQGLALYGPPPTAIIPPIDLADFLQVVKEQAASWRTRVTEYDGLPWQSYAIITMCRAMYATRYGEQVSKLKATTWAAQEYPQWADTIQAAVVWRHELDRAEANAQETLPNTIAFVNFAADQVAQI